MISEFKEKEGTTVIEKTNYGGYEGDYGGRRERNTRALAGTALGIAIGAGVLSLWNRGGLGSILSGNGGGSNGGGTTSGGFAPSNVNVNCGGGGGSTFGMFEKECADVLALTNLVWSKASAAREVDVAEKFSLYNSQITADFGLYKDNRDNLDRVNNRINNELFSLYKYTRDKDDETRKELCDLKAQIAVSNAVRPYQDRLLQNEIATSYATMLNYVNRELCLRPKGTVVLPTTPTITGIGNYCCGNAATTGA
jgi:hypothetical protein